jgi:galactokinase
VALLGQVAHAVLLDCRDWTTEQVPWLPAESDVTLLVVDTRASHSLVDGGYESRRRDCEEAVRQLGVASLREVSDGEDAVAALSDPRIRRRVGHVLSEIARVREAVAQIRERDFESLGSTFTASHASMRDDYEISCPELDAVVDAAMANGALGARMTGGGFGGSAIALVPRAQVAAVEAAAAAAFDGAGWPAPGFLTADAAGGARQLR